MKRKLISKISHNNIGYKSAVFDTIFDKIENQIVYEIGVGPLLSCRTLSFIGTNNVCYLFEPNPTSYKILKNYFSRYDNFHVYDVALGNVDRINVQDGMCVFVLEPRGSSYIEGVYAPLYHTGLGENNPRVQVKFKDVSFYDKGNIDFLYLDTEGSEFYILEKLISRPKGIVVEMESVGVNYRHKHYDDIMDWMKVNGYEERKVINGEDHVFVAT